MSNRGEVVVLSTDVGIAIVPLVVTSTVEETTLDISSMDGVLLSSMDVISIASLDEVGDMK